MLTPALNAIYVLSQVDPAAARNTIIDAMAETGQLAPFVE